MRGSRSVGAFLSLAALALWGAAAPGWQGAGDDGTIVAWGSNASFQCDVPEPNEGFIAVAAGHYHGLGLRRDGVVVVWGNNNYGQWNIPAPNAGFAAVAGGAAHSVGLKRDGTIVAWGWNNHGQCEVPAPGSGFAAAAAGGWHSLGLTGASASAVPEPGRPAGSARLAVVSLAPNPSPRSTVLSLELAESSPLILEVLDAGGRRIAARQLGRMGPGIGHVVWDGRGEGGVDLECGVYYLRVRDSAGRSEAVRAVLIR